VLGRVLCWALEGGFFRRDAFVRGVDLYATFSGARFGGLTSWR
jgi:hypothetical protein